MGMKPEYYPRGYGTDRSRRTQSAVGTKPPAVAASPVPQREVPPATATDAAPLETQPLRPTPPAFVIDRQTARLGVIWAEILGAPRARRPWGEAREAKGTEPFASRLKVSP